MNLELIKDTPVELDHLIEWLLSVWEEKPGKLVNLSEAEILWLIWEA
jgi:hypothetical protein